MKKRRTERTFKFNYQYIIRYGGQCLVAMGRDIQVTEFGLLRVKKSWELCAFAYTGKKSKLNRVAAKHSVVSYYKGGEFEGVMMVKPDFIRGGEGIIHDNELEAMKAMDNKLTEVAGVDTTFKSSLIQHVAMMISSMERMGEKDMVRELTGGKE